MGKLVGLYLGMGGGILNEWNDRSNKAELGRQSEESKFTGAKFHGESLLKEE